MLNCSDACSSGSGFIANVTRFVWGNATTVPNVTAVDDAVLANATRAWNGCSFDASVCVGAAACNLTCGDAAGSPVQLAVMWQCGGAAAIAAAPVAAAAGAALPVSAIVGAAMGLLALLVLAVCVACYVLPAVALRGKPSPLSYVPGLSATTTPTAVLTHTPLVAATASAAAAATSVASQAFVHSNPLAIIRPTLDAAAQAASAALADATAAKQAAAAAAAATATSVLTVWTVAAATPPEPVAPPVMEPTIDAGAAAAAVTVAVAAATATRSHAVTAAPLQRSATSTAPPPRRYADFVYSASLKGAGGRAASIPVDLEVAQRQGVSYEIWRRATHGADGNRLVFSTRERARGLG